LPAAATFDSAILSGCWRAFGFELDRQSGSHRIYRHSALRLRMNIQPEGGKAKLYQIRQLLDLVETHGLRLRE